MNLEEHEFSLQGGQELRVEIGFDQTLGILLDLGMAEKFGEELPPGTWRYFVGPSNFSIFTWHGCKLKVSGSCTDIYPSQTETPMPGYLLAHGTINTIRYESCSKRRLGPKVLVAGGSCCGKSALCQILLNYAGKCGWRPVFVELDVTNNNMFAPGCISAASYTQNAWDPILAYYFGHARLDYQETEIFKTIVMEMATLVNARLAKELEYSRTHFPNSYDARNNSYASGCVINFPPFLDMSLSEVLLNFIIDCFQVDIVLIIDQEKLTNNIKRRGIEPITLSKLGCVVPLQAEYKFRIQTHQLNSYFAQFQIHQLTLSFSEIEIYRIVVSVFGSSMGTYGDSSQGERLILMQLPPSQEDLMHAILGVVADPKDVMKSPIYGLVHVVEVDEMQRVVKVLAPGQLISKVFILGSLNKLK